MALKVLLATTCRWFTTARLAMAFRRAGCEVDLVCPPNHPVFSTQALQQSYRYHGVTAQQSLRNAILKSAPDIVIPCDDVAMRHMHRLYWAVSQTNDKDSIAIFKLLQLSMGNPDGYPITESREKFVALLHQLEVRVPETSTVNSVDQVEEWLAQFGLPAVLKADGTSGGEGVRIVHTVPEALRAYKTLHAPLATVVVAKRTLINRDSNCIVPWLMQQPRQVSIQRFVAGLDATVAVACWQGEALASIDAEVVRTSQPKGPATIVRLCRNDQRLQAVQKVVRKLGFTGMCGFDFMMDSANGEAYLIEMNARATQTCPLPLGPQGNLIASFCTAIGRQPFAEEPLKLSGDTIALFPMAWQGDTSSDLFQSCYHDVPIDEPGLVSLGMKEIQITFAHKLKQTSVRLFSALGLHQP